MGTETVSVMRAWMGEMSSASCPLVSAYTTLHPVDDDYMRTFFLMRRREVAHVPTACDTHAWMHAGSLTSSGAHKGPEPGSARETQSVRSFSRSGWSIADDVDTVECLTFTAKMPQAKITESYNRLRATVRGNDPTEKEVKLCYVTVCFSLPFSPPNWL